MVQALLKENADLATAVDFLDSWASLRVKQRIQLANRLSQERHHGLRARGIAAPD